MKCPICNLTLADPPNGEEAEKPGEARQLPALEVAKPSCTKPDRTGSQGSATHPKVAASGVRQGCATSAVIVSDGASLDSTTPPYRAEVIDNAVLALSGGIKL